METMIMIMILILIMEDIGKMKKKIKRRIHQLKLQKKREDQQPIKIQSILQKYLHIQDGIIQKEKLF